MASSEHGPPRRRSASDGAIDPHAVTIAQKHGIAARHEREARRLLAAACHLTRVRIVRALVETPLAASDLARIIGRTASGTSQHIRVLRDLGVVTAERRGNVVRYRLSKEHTAEILETIARAFDLLGKRENGRDR